MLLVRASFQQDILSLFPTQNVQPNERNDFNDDEIDMFMLHHRHTGVSANCQRWRLPSLFVA